MKISPRPHVSTQQVETGETTVGQSREVSDRFSHFFPEIDVDLLHNTPIFIELCAGSAKLSNAVRQYGYSVLPVDHDRNKHHPRCTIVQLDLSQPSAWEQLQFLLDNTNVAGVHFAPPCGTCSKARGIPMADGSPGPQPLRSKAFLLGLPGLSHRDKQRVHSANEIYRLCGLFVQQLEQRNIPWTIENPTNSWMWDLPYFIFALAHGVLVHLHACAYGAERKLTTFLASHEKFLQLERFCDDSHPHAPWGVDETTGTFNTALEAEYPIELCNAYAEVLHAICIDRGLKVQNLETGASHKLTPQKQPKGRSMPQLIAEYEFTPSLLLKSIPEVDDKKCIKKAISDIPMGSKLLRTEEKGGMNLCVFGIYRSPQAFVTVARQLWHPYDELRNLPDELIHTIFEHLSRSPSQVTSHRMKTLKAWTMRAKAKALRTLETELHDLMEPDVARIMKSKKILLMRSIAEDINWPDMKLFDEFTTGFKITGQTTVAGIFKQGVTMASLTTQQLEQKSKFLRPMILGRSKLSKDDEIQKELYEVTVEEAESKGWLDGPYTPEEISKQFGESWIPVRRFGVMQKKLRPIDDFKENNVNMTHASVEKIELRTMDHVLWSLFTLVQYLLFEERMQLGLKNGGFLSGPIHPDWKLVKPNFKSSCIDLKSAYKQLPLQSCERKNAIVTLCNPHTGLNECFVMKVLPFGASASVHHFLRTSAFLQAVGRHLGLVWSAFFDDFVLISHAVHEKSSLTSALTLFDLFGFAYSDDKLQPFQEITEMLGVELDLTGAANGCLKVRNKQSRVSELSEVLTNILSTGKVQVAQLPSTLGKLQFAEAQLWGRSGRLALADLRIFEKAEPKTVELDGRAIEAVKRLQNKLLNGKPRSICISKKSTPFLLFTDGALEYDSQGRGVAGIGAVLLCPDSSIHVFGTCVSDDVLKSWQVNDKEHVVGLVELYAVAVAFRTWERLLADQRVICFTDSWPVFDVVVKGNSTKPEWRDLLLIIEDLDERSPMLLWMARVPSKSNPADAPSRFSLQDISFLQPFNVCEPVCPITGKTMKSMV